jgi:hypothetical protein
VELGTGKRPEYCFHTPQQKWDKDMIQTYNKGKACTIMVWAAFCRFGQSELVYIPGDPETKCSRVIAAVYQEILEDELSTL